MNLTLPVMLRRPRWLNGLGPNLGSWVMFSDRSSACRLYSLKSVNRREAAVSQHARRQPQVILPAVLILAAMLSCCVEPPSGARIATAGQSTKAVDIVTGVPTLELQQQLRIDGYAADLAPIGRLAIGPNGTIAVLQPQDHTIRLFSHSGELLGVLGRRGSGPGEFVEIHRVGWLADTLWVYDSRLRRITLTAVDRDLSPSRTIALSAVLRGLSASREVSPGVVFPYALRQGGSVVVVAGRSAVTGDNDRSARAVFVVALSPGGPTAHEILRLPTSGGEIVIELPEGGRAMATVPFHPFPALTAAPNGDRVALLTSGGASLGPGEFMLTVVGPGAKRADWRYQSGAVEISRAAADSVIERRKRIMRTVPLKEVFEKHAKELMPRYYPPATDLFIGLDGRIWVGLRKLGGTREWLILGAEGEVVGTITLPESVRPQAADERDVWTLEPDEFGVESIVRYRIGAARRESGLN